MVAGTSSLPSHSALDLTMEKHPRPTIRPQPSRTGSHSTMILLFVLSRDWLMQPFAGDFSGSPLCIARSVTQWRRIYPRKNLLSLTIDYCHVVRHGSTEIFCIILTRDEPLSPEAQAKDRDFARRLLTKAPRFLREFLLQASADEVAELE